MNLLAGLLLAGTLIQVPPEPPPTIPPDQWASCTIYYWLSAYHELMGSLNIGPMSTYHADIEVLREQIMGSGFLMPDIDADPETDDFYPPAGFQRLGIRKLCCRIEGPPENWWCRAPGQVPGIAPDGEPLN